jgi:molybdopterin converting factor small subunit
MFIKLYECEGENTADNIESIFHTLLEHRNTHGEWFKDEDETILESVSSVMNNLKNIGVYVQEIDLGLDPNLTKVEKEQIEKSKNSKIKLIYNGVDLSSRFSVTTYIKGLSIMRDIVGWDKIIDEGDVDVFRSVEELYEKFPIYREREVKVYEKVDDYYVWTNLNNVNKLRRLNKLITKFDIVGMTCSIDL